MRPTHGTARRTAANNRATDGNSTVGRCPPSEPAETARAFWTVAPGRGEIRTETLTDRAGRRRCSCARAVHRHQPRDRSHCVHGRVPPSEYERMRAPFQAGSSLRRSSTATQRRRRRAGPADADRPDRVRAVSAPDALRRAGVGRARLPDDVPPARAVLAANLETAINGLWDGSPRIGDRIAVVGGGTVGCLVAWLAGRIAGCEVELVDINPHRARDRARARRRLRTDGAALAHGESPTSCSTRADRRPASRWRCGSPASRRRSSS